MKLDADIAANGLEALSNLQEAPEDLPYTLILMDCQMPEMDGYEATQRIRAGKAGSRYINIPIIAMTANAMQVDKEKCISTGMTDYISKPVDGRTLLETLKNYLSFEVTPTETIISSPATTPSIERKCTEAVSNQEHIVWDLEALLVRVYQNKALLETILKTFIKDKADNINQLKHAYNAKNFPQVRMIAHTVKGVSGQLCGDDLRAVAEKIEKYASNPDTITKPLDMTDLVFSFEQKMQALANEFETYLSSQSLTENDSTSTQENQLNIDELEQKLAELSAKIKLSEYVPPDSLTVLQQYHEADTELHAQLNTLVEQINLFDNDSASATLMTIQQIIMARKGS